MKYTIFAGIVLYNPEINRLKENISHIKKQVDKVIVVNNGSDNTKEIEDYINTIDCIYIRLNENMGIAAALNMLANETKNRNCNWLITLDQDTVCKDNLVENYSKYICFEKVGQITCLYEDRNFQNEGCKDTKELTEVAWCITSAALLNIRAWEDVGGFDERLFIDAVDYDICLTMKGYGYKIYCANFVGFIHEIGKGNELKLGLFKVKTWNHSAFRRYYSARNAIIVAKKHEEISLFHTICGTIKHIIIIFIFENHKWEKLKCGVKGLIHGLKTNVNK